MLVVVPVDIKAVQAGVTVEWLVAAKELRNSDRAVEAERAKAEAERTKAEAERTKAEIERTQQRNIDLQIKKIDHAEGARKRARSSSKEQNETTAKTVEERLSTASWKPGMRCLSREIIEGRQHVDTDALNSIAQTFFDARSAHHPWARHVQVQRVTWEETLVFRLPSVRRNKSAFWRCCGTRHLGTRQPTSFARRCEMPSPSVLPTIDKKSRPMIPWIQWNHRR